MWDLLPEESLLSLLCFFFLDIHNDKKMSVNSVHSILTNSRIASCSGGLGCVRFYVKNVLHQHRRKPSIPIAVQMWSCFHTQTVQSSTCKTPSNHLLQATTEIIFFSHKIKTVFCNSTIRVRVLIHKLETGLDKCIFVVSISSHLIQLCRKG